MDLSAFEQAALPRTKTIPIKRTRRKYLMERVIYWLLDLTV
jgi:hypothetical protein